MPGRSPVGSVRVVGGRRRGTRRVARLAVACVCVLATAASVSVFFSRATFTVYLAAALWLTALPIVVAINCLLWRRQPLSSRRATLVAFLMAVSSTVLLLDRWTLPSFSGPMYGREFDWTVGFSAPPDTFRDWSFRKREVRILHTGGRLLLRLQIEGVSGRAGAPMILQVDEEPVRFEARLNGMSLVTPMTSPGPGVYAAILDAPPQADFRFLVLAELTHRSYIEGLGRTRVSFEFQAPEGQNLLLPPNFEELHVVYDLGIPGARVESADSAGEDSARQVEWQWGNFDSDLDADVYVTYDFYNLLVDACLGILFLGAAYYLGNAPSEVSRGRGRTEHAV